MDKLPASAPARDVTLPAVPSAASAARRAVLGTVADHGVDGYAVALAVSEAVTNVIVHADRDRDAGAGPGEVHVTVTVEDDELLVTVSDDGLGAQASRREPRRGPRHSAHRGAR